MGFEKATKEGTRLRAAVFGPSGSGKTFSSLLIGTGMAGEGGKIALIDSERRTARKYSDRFEFDVWDLEERTIEAYIEAIKAADDYAVLIIDSITHAWKALCDEVQVASQGSKFRGNYWAAWSEGTPRQVAFIDAIYNSNCHIFATMRSVTEWQTANTPSGIRPTRIGLKPDQGKDIEYEFDMLLEFDEQHHARVLKDRTGKFQDQIIQKPSEDFGRELAAWLNTSPEMAARVVPTTHAAPPTVATQAPASNVPPAVY